MADIPMAAPCSRLEPASTSARQEALANPIMLGTRWLNGLWQIAGWDDFEIASASVLRRLGVNSLGGFQTAQQSGAVTTWRIAPDRLLIEGSGDLSDTVSESLAVLDLSHARMAITLDGPAARDLLTQVVALDMSPMVWGPGDFRQTGIHGVGVLIHCTGATRFDILVPVTWAETVWDVLYDNAIPHGLTTHRSI